MSIDDAFFYSGIMSGRQMALQTCGPRVPAHDNKGMNIELLGINACKHGELGTQSVWADLQNYFEF